MNAADLRRRRAALGLHQHELAERLGVTQSAVSRWEAGVRAIPALLERAIRDLEREHDAEQAQRA